MIVPQTISLTLLLLQLRAVAAQFQLYVNGTHSTENLSQGCISALNATISCDPYIQQLAASDFYGSLGNATLQDTVCLSGCGTSLTSYHTSVTSACANDPNPWPGVPAVWTGDVLWATYNRTCLKDPATGQYCVDQIAAINTGDVDTPLSSLTNEQLCNPCVIALLKGIQSTPFSNYDDTYIQEYLAVQSKCNTGPLPTAVQPPATNITSLPGVVISDPADTTCLSGNHYTVQSGDDVQKIAVAHNVATGTLKLINGIFPDGTNLFAGQDLCLPRTCSTYLVKSGDTCVSIAAAQGISFSQLVSYNPAINMDCSNLIADTNICIGPSGTQYTPTTIPGVTVTSTSYATATVTPPGSTAFGTTKNCGKYYQVNPGDTCQQISLNSTITVDLFEEINPSINADCTNLVPGLYYCVWPTANWNETVGGGTSTTVPPPGPTPTGTTPVCYEWHVIVSGDTCSLIAASYGITFDQLRTWNPQLDAQCSNLLLGDAQVYCVNGGSTTTTTPTTTPTPTPTTVTPPGPTQPGIPSNCNKYVLQQDGVFCFDMAQNAGITLDQLYAWNPALNGDCSGLWVGYAYCVGVSSSFSAATTSSSAARASASAARRLAERHLRQRVVDSVRSWF